jgi:hypothetical protein
VEVAGGAGGDANANRHGGSLLQGEGYQPMSLPGIRGVLPIGAAWPGMIPRKSPQDPRGMAGAILIV